jgi:hypothetical protein
MLPRVLPRVLPRALPRVLPRVLPRALPLGRVTLPLATLLRVVAGAVEEGAFLAVSSGKYNQQCVGV